jgi:hypothetical protein
MRYDGAESKTITGTASVLTTASHIRPGIRIILFAEAMQRVFLGLLCRRILLLCVFSLLAVFCALGPFFRFWANAGAASRAAAVSTTINLCMRASSEAARVQKLTPAIVQNTAIV